MKSTTLLLLGLIAIIAFAAYLIGRESGRLASVQAQVNQLEVQVYELRVEKIRREVRWAWLRQIGSLLRSAREFVHNT